MKAIVAVDEKWGIGKENDLLFSLPADMKFFRQTTLNKIVVMGSKTLKSFPNGAPLKNRTNIVLSTTIERDDCVVAKSVDALLETLKNYPTDDIYVIGGAMLYKTLLPYCEQALVTKVEADGGAEVFFENLDNMEGWQKIAQSEPLETNGYNVRFTTYENKNVKEF